MKRDDDVSNLEALERAIASWNRGDLAQYLRLYSVDVVLHGYTEHMPFIQVPSIQALLETYRAG